MNAFGLRKLPEGIGFFLVIDGVVASGMFQDFGDFLKALGNAKWEQLRRAADGFHADVKVMAAVARLPLNYGLVIDEAPSERRFGFVDRDNGVSKSRCSLPLDAAFAAITHSNILKQREAADISKPQQPPRQE